ncbi:hypothetical protein KSS87_002353, partial [Heliosperma pusillum]
MRRFVVVKNMDSAKSWLHKFQPRDRFRSTSKKKDSAMAGREGSSSMLEDDTPSNITKQRVAAAKQYIEKHYKEQRKNLQERRE